LLQTAQRIGDSHFGQISLPVILDALGVRLPRVVDQDKVTAGSRISGTSAGGNLLEKTVPTPTPGPASNFNYRMKENAGSPGSLNSCGSRRLVPPRIDDATVG